MGARMAFTPAASALALAIGLALSLGTPTQAQAQGWRLDAATGLQWQDAQGRTALLTTDIEAAQEAELLARSAPGSLAVDLLLVPHHGSNTSSTAAFIAAVQPSLALAQSGHRNRHGHPALPVVQRYHAAGVPLVTSAGCGAFDWWSASGPPSPAMCRRAQAPRYWHNPALVSELAPVADPLAGPERSAPEN